MGGWAQMAQQPNESVYFLTTIRPLWEADSFEATWRLSRRCPAALVPSVCHDVGTHWAVCGIRTPCHHTQRDRPVDRGFGGALPLVSLGYIALWFENLNVHDYYLIELQLGVPVVAAGGDGRWKADANEANVHSMDVFIVAALMLQLIDAGLRIPLDETPTDWPADGCTNK